MVLVKSVSVFVMLCLASVTISIVTAAPPADECKNRFIEYTFAKRHQCQIDYIAELSKAKGLEELWNQFQPKFQQNIENWKACAETGIMDRFECNIQEASEIAQNYVIYVVEADTRNLEFGKEYFRIVAKKCP